MRFQPRISQAEETSVDNAFPASRGSATTHSSQSVTAFACLDDAERRLFPSTYFRRPG